MNICVFGKLGHITHWMEHLAFAADSKGRDTSIFSVKGISLIERFNIKYGKIFCKNFNEFPAQLFLKHIRKHKPDIIFFIGPVRSLSLVWAFSSRTDRAVDGPAKPPSASRPTAAFQVGLCAVVMTCARVASGAR